MLATASPSAAACATGHPENAPDRPAADAQTRSSPQGQGCSLKVPGLLPIPRRTDRAVCANVAITCDTLHSLVLASSIPPEWYDPDRLSVLVADLLERQLSIGEYISGIGSFLDNISKWKGNGEELRIQGAKLRSDAHKRTRSSVPCNRQGALS